jgi:hypothetical protein
MTIDLNDYQLLSIFMVSIVVLLAADYFGLQRDSHDPGSRQAVHRLHFQQPTADDRYRQEHQLLW